MRSFTGTILPKNMFHVQICTLDMHIINKHNIILLSFTRHATFVKIKMHNLKEKKVQQSNT